MSEHKGRSARGRHERGWGALGWRAAAIIRLALGGVLAAPLPFAWAATVTLEAETMPTKTTGGPVTDGWALWSNGYIEGPATFPAMVEYTFQVVARGDSGGGSFPIMDVRINQSSIGNFRLTSSTWQIYTIKRTVSAGTHQVAVVFTNDYYGGVGNDRNLYVDKILIDPAQDLTPPTGTVVINGGAAATNRGTVTLTLSATDTAGAVTQMRFSNSGTTYSTPEAYATTKTWTLTSGNGVKTVYAQFKDAAGNWSAAATDTIVYDTAIPTVSGVSASAITGSSATILWTTNEPASSQVDYGPTTNYGTTTPLDAALVLTHGVPLSGLTASTKYYYRIRSKDVAGNERVTGAYSFTTTAAQDTTPPTVALTAPVGGATVSGTVTVSATATDNVGVASVQFQLDGVNLGAEDLASPYSLSWDTKAATNAGHTLTAAARDAVGNRATSPAVVVTVHNVPPDTTPPSGSITINGGAAATNTPVVSLALAATDDAGAVAQMQFSNDGITYSAAEAYGTSKAWTLAAGDGVKTVYAKFKDPAGNWSAAATDTIILDTTPPGVTFLSPVDGAVLTAP